MEGRKSKLCIFDHVTIIHMDFQWIYLSCGNYLPYMHTYNSCLVFNSILMHNCLMLCLLTNYLNSFIISIVVISVICRMLRLLIMTRMYWSKYAGVCMFQPTTRTQRRMSPRPWSQTIWYRPNPRNTGLLILRLGCSGLQRIITRVRAGTLVLVRIQCWNRKPSFALWRTWISHQFNLELHKEAELDPAAPYYK